MQFKSKEQSWSLYASLTDIESVINFDHREEMELIFNSGERVLVSNERLPEVLESMDKSEIYSRHIEVQ